MGRTAHSIPIPSHTERGIRLGFAVPDTRGTMETAASAAMPRLGDIFVERGLISGEQLEEALQQQRETGGKLGEILVDLGFVTRVALAGVISEQWDAMRVSQSGRKNAESEARRTSAPASGGSVVERALSDRIEALTAELAERDRRIAQLDATVAALLSRLDSAA